MMKQVILIEDTDGQEREKSVLKWKFVMIDVQGERGALQKQLSEQRGTVNR